MKLFKFKVNIFLIENKEKVLVGQMKIEAEDEKRAVHQAKQQVTFESNVQD